MKSDTSGEGISAEELALASVGGSGRVRGSAYREGVAAVIAVDTPESSRFLVICHAIDGNWIAPSLMNANAVGAARPEFTRAPTYISDLSSSQTAAPGPERPAAAWSACAGIAAKDAAAVKVTTHMDSTLVEVGSDGFFLALIKSGWGEQLKLTVRTGDGHEVQVEP